MGLGQNCVLPCVHLFGNSKKPTSGPRLFLEITRFPSETKQFLPGSVFFPGAGRECRTVVAAVVAAGPTSFFVKVSISLQQVGVAQKLEPRNLIIPLIYIYIRRPRQTQGGAR